MFAVSNCSSDLGRLRECGISHYSTDWQDRSGYDFIKSFYSFGWKSLKGCYGSPCWLILVFFISEVQKSVISAIEGCRCIGVCFSTNCEKIVFADEKSGKPLCVTEHSWVSCSTLLAHEIGGSAKINSKVPISSTKYHVLFYNRKRSWQVSALCGSNEFVWSPQGNCVTG